jgi:hypothetical protein
MRIAACLGALFLAAAALAQAPAEPAAPAPGIEPADPALVERVLRQRQALFNIPGLDAAQLSVAIGAGLREAARLELAGRHAEALARLEAITPSLPLEDLPSAEVHLRASWAHMRLGRNEASARHRALALAAREVLLRHIGTGASREQPLRVVMDIEAHEWVRAQRGRVRDVHTAGQGERELMLLTYAMPASDTATFVVYAQVDARTRQAARPRDRFARVPQAAMTSAQLAAFQEARSRRERFLSDNAFDYQALQRRMDDAYAQAMKLDRAGQPEEALRQLLEIEKIRPLAEIPTPQLWGFYGYLLGRTGRTAGQPEVDAMVFGIRQAVAHSGDGNDVRTAVQVILPDEEADWLAAKQLVRVRHRFASFAGRVYSVVVARDAAGRETDLYFEITAVARRFESRYKR